MHSPFIKRRHHRGQNADKELTSRCISFNVTEAFLFKVCAAYECDMRHRYSMNKLPFNEVAMVTKSEGEKSTTDTNTEL